MEVSSNMYKFIFVDDEDLMRELFTDIIDFSKYQFILEETFASAEEALSYLKEHNDIALVVTDVKMGQMSGLDFCEEIRKDNPHIQLVIISGYQEFELVRGAMKQNVFDYLPKPTSYNDLHMLFTALETHLIENNRIYAENMQTANTDYHYTQLIDTVKIYIDENYNKDISLEDVAKHVSLNPSYLSRFFKHHTNCKFIDYLSKLRVEKAKEMLQDNKIKVYEICDRVGYKNIQHFYKVFKNFTGYTPSEFRKHISDKTMDDD